MLLAYGSFVLPENSSTMLLVNMEGVLFALIIIWQWYSLPDSKRTDVVYSPQSLPILIAIPVATALILNPAAFNVLCLLGTVAVYPAK